MGSDDFEGQLRLAVTFLEWCWFVVWRGDDCYSLHSSAVLVFSLIGVADEVNHHVPLFLELTYKSKCFPHVFPQTINQPGWADVPWPLCSLTHALVYSHTDSNPLKLLFKQPFVIWLLHLRKIAAAQQEEEGVENDREMANTVT